jgi:hypothetical protein
VQAKLRRLSRLLQTTLGPTRIVATLPDTSSVFLNAFYVGGAETQFGSEANQYFANWVLQMQAPQPFWETSTEVSFIIGEEPTGRGLLPQLTKLKVSSGEVLGEIDVNNLGDVVSYPRWRILGPISNLTISNGTQEFSFPDLIPSGEIIVVDTLTGAVVDEAGENVYSLLAPAPKLFTLPPGQSVISVTGDDTAEETRVGFFYRPRYEVVH